MFLVDVAIPQSSTIRARRTFPARAADFHGVTMPRAEDLITILCRVGGYKATMYCIPKNATYFVPAYNIYQVYIHIYIPVTVFMGEYTVVIRTKTCYQVYSYGEILGFCVHHGF